MSDNEPIDLAPFFLSSKVPADQSRFSLFKSVGFVDGNAIVEHSKFNQLNNFEMFVITPNAILMRYEISPEIYGGDQNAMRRFRDIPVRPEDIRDATALPVNGDNGAMWFKRIVTKAEAGKTYISAQAIDHVVYTSPHLPGALSVPYAPVYNWFEFTKSTLQVPFVRSGEAILRIYSQWHRCTTEVYEYAEGVGLIAWRALDSSSPSCHRDLDASKPSVVLKNHFIGAEERFYIVAGDHYDGTFAHTVYPTRVVQNYTPGGIFMDDFTYNFTSLNPGLLNFLRPVTPQPPVTPPSVFDYSKDIQSYYKMYLGRTADDSEVIYWINMINAGMISLNQAQDQIQNSQEAIIRGFYLTYLHREPDYDGLSYWRQQNNNGLSYDSIRDYIRSAAN